MAPHGTYPAVRCWTNLYDSRVTVTVDAQQIQASTHHRTVRIRNNGNELVTLPPTGSSRHVIEPVVANVLPGARWTSKLKIHAHAVTLIWPGVYGKTYCMENATTLIGPWAESAAGIPVETPTPSYPILPTSTQAFFRVGIEQFIMKTYPILICVLALSFCTMISPAQEPERCVRFIYLVSNDREPVAQYITAIENAAVDIQGWYAKQLDGPTFRLADPIVEVVHSDKSAAWFTTHSNGTHVANYGFRNTLDEMKRMRDVSPNRDRSVWVVYSDGPGDSGRAFKGFAYLPEDDLLGLVGKHPTQPDPIRWVAGMGHELGHALGLPHPSDTRKHRDALMWAGFYGKYPDRCYLTDQDKEILAANPFIGPR